MRLPLLCEKSGAILLVLMGFTVGRQSDKIKEDLKSSTDCIVRMFIHSQFSSVVVDKDSCCDIPYTVKHLRWKTFAFFVIFLLKRECNCESFPPRMFCCIRY